MTAREVFGAEPSGVEQRHSQSVAQSHLCRGACSWCEVVRTSLLCDATVENPVCMAGQAAVWLPCHANQHGTQTLDKRQYRVELITLAAVADRQHHIVGRDHPQVTVTGLCWVNEEGRGSS
jgi:hypothetical protein